MLALVAPGPRVTKHTPGDRSRGVQGAVGAGHERRAAFLTAGNGLNFLALAQRVEHWQEALAGNRENSLAALFDEAIDQQAGGIGRHGQGDSRPAGMGQSGPNCLCCGQWAPRPFQMVTTGLTRAYATVPGPHRRSRPAPVPGIAAATRVARCASSSGSVARPVVARRTRFAHPTAPASPDRRFYRLIVIQRACSTVELLFRLVSRAPSQPRQGT